MVVIIEDEGVKEIYVFVYVCFFLVIVYIFFGIVLFSFWEFWDFLMVGYFCFIIFSMIGFGDVVLGYSLEFWVSQVKCIMCVFYFLFGFIFIFMCFSLLVDEVQDKIRRFG